MVVSESSPQHCNSHSLSSSVHKHTHTPSLFCSISPSGLLFYLFMDVKPVIPIRMKMLQMKGTAIKVLVLVMVEWLMECVCICTLPFSSTSPSFPLVLSLRNQVCPLPWCQGREQHLLGDSYSLPPQVYSVLGNTNTHLHAHSFSPFFKK